MSTFAVNQWLLGTFRVSFNSFYQQKQILRLKDQIKCLKENVIGKQFEFRPSLPRMFVPWYGWRRQTTAIYNFLVSLALVSNE